MSRMYPPVSLIGVPTDVGAGHRGARMGPDALRIAGLGEALAAMQRRSVDLRSWTLAREREKWARVAREAWTARRAAGRRRENRHRRTSG